MKPICALLLLALLPAGPAVGADERLPLFASIPTQKYLLERIGGEHLDIRIMLGPGANPHNYDPPPRRLVALGRAAAYFTIGVPFEQMWQARLRAVNPAVEFIHCGADPSNQHQHQGHEHHHDPHVWTSPVAVQAISDCLLVALERLDPARAPVYAANHDRLRRDLIKLDEEIRELLAPLAARYLLVQHPAWDHFATTYGFEQVAIERDGHEPNARHLARVIEFARSQGLNTVFVQPQYSAATARLVADAIGGRVVELDPLAEDYIKTMRRVARAIAAGQPG